MEIEIAKHQFLSRNLYEHETRPHQTSVSDCDSKLHANDTTLIGTALMCRS